MNQQQRDLQLNRRRLEQIQGRREREQLSLECAAAERNFGITRSFADRERLEKAETRLRHKDLALKAVQKEIERLETPEPAQEHVADATPDNLLRWRREILFQQQRRRDERQEQIAAIRAPYPGSPEHHHQTRIQNKLGMVLQRDKVAEADEAERIAGIDAQLALLDQGQVQPKGAA
jgi:hypothetical protein